MENHISYDGVILYHDEIIKDQLHRHFIGGRRAVKRSCAGIFIPSKTSAPNRPLLNVDSDLYNFTWAAQDIAYIYQKQWEG